MEILGISYRRPIGRAAFGNVHERLRQGLLARDYVGGLEVVIRGFICPVSRLASPRGGFVAVSCLVKDAVAAFQKHICFRGG